MLDTLKLALQSNQTVAFIYDDKQRVVEVHAVGLSTKDGSPVMRGFQVAGERNGWALFTLSKIDALELSPMPLSEAPRDGYKMADKQMREILFQIELETTDA